MEILSPRSTDIAHYGFCRTYLQQLTPSAVRWVSKSSTTRNSLLSRKQRILSLSSSDGTSASADILLGCDGIHSPVRGTLPPPDLHRCFHHLRNTHVLDHCLMPFSATAINTSCNDSMVTSCCNAAKTYIFEFFADVMKITEQKGDDGWRIHFLRLVPLRPRRCGRGERKSGLGRVIEVLQIANEMCHCWRVSDSESVGR